MNGKVKWGIFLIDIILSTVCSSFLSHTERLGQNPPQK